MPELVHFNICDINHFVAYVTFHFTIHPLLRYLHFACAVEYRCIDHSLRFIWYWQTLCEILGSCKSKDKFCYKFFTKESLVLTNQHFLLFLQYFLIFPKQVSTFESQGFFPPSANVNNLGHSKIFLFIEELEKILLEYSMVKYS